MVAVLVVKAWMEAGVLTVGMALMVAVEAWLMVGWLKAGLAVEA